MKTNKRSKKPYNKFKGYLVKSKRIFGRLYLIFILIISITSGWINFIFGFFFLVFIFFVNIFTRKIPLETKNFDGPYTYTYKEIVKEELKLDLWYPKLKKQKHPFILFTHGGGWISGFRNQSNNISWCKYLASKGFAVASIDYRYAIKNNMHDLLHDYKDALNYLKKNNIVLRLDKNNIILMGLSAGGHLALLYSAYMSFNRNKNELKGIKGVVSYYAPSDLLDLISNQEVKSYFAKFAVKTSIKGSPNKNIGQYKYFSPISWISSRMLPTLLVHGKLDDVVPFDSSIKLIRKLKEYNINNKFLVHRSGGHTFEFYMKDFLTIKIIDKTQKFIKDLISYEH